MSDPYIEAIVEAMTAACWEGMCSPARFENADSDVQRIFRRSCHAALLAALERMRWTDMDLRDAGCAVPLPRARGQECAIYGAMIDNLRTRAATQAFEDVFSKGSGPETPGGLCDIITSTEP